MGKLKSTLRGAFAAVGSVVVLASPGWAHPHVFVKVKTQLVAKGGVLVGIKHTWLFDQTWIDNQLLEHDKDGDGKLSRAELGPLEAESKATLEMFKSFTLVRAGGAVIRVAAPRDLSVDYHGAAMGLSFTVNLAKPVPLAGDVLVEVYDATYFSSFAFEGAEAVAFAEEAPAGCTIKADAPASPQQMNAYRMIKKQMGPEFVDMGVPKSVLVSCAKGGAVGSNEPMAVHQPVAAR